MTIRHVLCGTAIALSLTAVPLGAALAKPFMIVGCDEKFVWNEEGKIVLSPPGKDSVLVLDLANPAEPKVIAALPVENSVAGPPTNLAIHPSGKFAVVANSLDVVSEGGALKAVPDDKIAVIDLTATPPKVIAQVKGGKQPSGLDISPKGDLMVVGNRADKSVSLFSIKGTDITLADTLTLPDSVAHAAFTPDGRQVLAVRNLANLVSLAFVVDGKLVYDKRDLPVGVAPYNAMVTPDGKLALTADQGGAVPDGNADTVSVIDLEAQPPRVSDRIGVEDFPEGLAISPDGKLAAVGILRGGISPHAAPFYHKTGQLQILKIDGKKVSKLNVLETGGIPEPINFSPDGRFLYVGNFSDQNLAVYKVAGDKVTDTGKRIALPGHPVSARVGPNN